jgi:hypothetical protein
MRLKQSEVEQSPAGVCFAGMPNSVFYAFVFDVFGNTSSRAKDFINHLSTHHARVSEYKWDDTVIFVRRKLILSGLQGTVALLRSRYVDSPFAAEYVGEGMDAGG